VNVKTVTNRRFFEALEEHGFSRLPNEKNAYVRSVDDGRCNQHVDVEFHDYMNAFSVMLQEVCRDLTRRRQSLGEFEGEDFYRYDPDADQSIEAAVSNAVSHLAKFGLRWFGGEEIETPSLRERSQKVSALKFDRMVHDGRAAFKSGDYDQAHRLLAAAAKIQDLDEVSRKYADIAERRIKES
jgi:hypothetical protein